MSDVGFWRPGYCVLRDELGFTVLYKICERINLGGSEFFKVFSFGVIRVLWSKYGGSYPIKYQQNNYQLLLTSILGYRYYIDGWSLCNIFNNSLYLLSSLRK